jgi:hypothetical protein
MNAETIVTESSPWWRVEQAAEFARVHKSQIFRACALRQLEHVKVGGRRTIITRREWVNAWLESMRVYVAPAGAAQ